MKKEELCKKIPTEKNECIFRTRSLSPKAYLGCDTCRSKKVTSNNKINDCNNAQDKNKRKKVAFKKDEGEFKNKNEKVKLIDLCDEDKGRIVELIEELAKVEEKNEELKVKIDEMQKERQEQRNHMLQQANLFLEEKNFFISEMKKYKNKLEEYEMEMNSKISSWEKNRRLKDSKIMYFAKALQKSLKEKNELHELMNRLKTCLKNSLESFQKLRTQVSELQNQEQNKKIYKSICCQTAEEVKDKCKASDTETEEEFFSACNQGSAKPKGSLEVINDKIEYMYRILKQNREVLSNSPPQKLDIDLSILLKNNKLLREERTVENDCLRNEDDPKILKVENDGTEELFQKTEKKCNKNLTEVEDILNNIGNPLNFIVNECNQMLENNNLNEQIPKESSKDFVKCSNLLQNKIVQKNNLFKLSEDDQYDEDRILEELFYSDQCLNLGIDSILKLETKELGKYCNDRPFTW